jgi:aryl-alcohol dehydrogenase-like predicted oxidoreductase
MRSRRLGAHGPSVSVLGLGCNNFGWTIPADRSRAVVDAALDAGITLFDTADVYGETESESFLGRALDGRRDRAVIVTKFGYPGVPDAPELPGGSPEYLGWAVERSLERLRTDRIDLYMYHRPDGVTPLTETLGALGELAREGKILYAGLSNVDVAAVREAAEFAGREGVPLVAIENRYSLARRKAERELLPLCERLGLGFLPYYPLESGVLTGKYRRGEAPPAASRFDTTPGIWAPQRWLNDEMFDRVEALEQFASDRGRSLLELAIAGAAAMPAVASVIAGATRPEQVQVNAAAAEWELSEDDLAALRGLT